MERLSKLENLLTNVKDEIAQVNRELEQETLGYIARLVSVKKGLVNSIETSKGLNNLLLDYANSMGIQAEDNLNEISVYDEIVDCLDDLAIDTYAEDEEDEDDGVVGYCDNCGVAIYEEDEYLTNENGIFCDKDCEEIFLNEIDKEQVAE